MFWCSKYFLVPLCFRKIFPPAWMLPPEFIYYDKKLFLLTRNNVLSYEIFWRKYIIFWIVTTLTTTQRKTTSTQLLGWTRKWLCKPHPPTHRNSTKASASLITHSLMTTIYSVISNNKQGHNNNNNINNNRNNNNNINNKIISFRSLRLTFIDNK